MTNRSLFTLFSFLFFLTTAFAGKDTGNITGKVADGDNKPVAYANVLLLAGVDSTLVKAEYTDEEGAFELSNIPAGTYWLSVTFVGMADYVSPPFTLGTGESKAFPSITMHSAGIELAQVTVSARKPIVEVHADKTIFNIEGSINASGNNALELLRKAPGVVVDNNDNIMMSGKNGVQVYIDGKPSPLSASDLAAFLKTMQASEIATIEIISNPSARYDAAGNAGIINIRLKKDKRLGANANVNLDYSVGHLPQYNGSINGNYRSKKVNVFGRLGYSDYQNQNYFGLYREQYGTAYDQQNNGKEDGSSPSLRLGADYFINDKNTVGILVDGKQSDNVWRNTSYTRIYQLGQSVVDSILDAGSTQDFTRNNYNFNLNYRFDNAKGIILNVDADYGLYRNDGQEDQPNRYYNGDNTNGEPFKIKDFANNTETDIDITTFKIDHERPFAKGQLGVGLKYANVETDNTFDFFNVLEGEKNLDTGRSRRFVYSENVNAAYVNYSRQFNDALGIQVGVRAEQTNSDGMLTAYVPITGDSVVERNYLDFFPSGGLTYQLNPMNSLALTYSRRIDRPSYQDLNPFENRLDEKTFEKGNPRLNAQYTHSIALSHTFKYMYTTTLSFSRTTDLISRIVDIDDRDSTASFITWLNLGEQTNTTLNFSVPVQLTKWLNLYFNVNGYRQHNTGDFGDGKVVDITAWAVNGFAQATVSLPYDLAFEMSGWYNSPSIWEGNFRTKHIGSMDAGIQKKLMNGNANLKLSVSDIFKTSNWAGESFFGDLYIRGGGGWDSRRFKLSFSYSFGNQQVGNARRRTTGLEDEKNRIKSGN